MEKKEINVNKQTGSIWVGKEQNETQNSSIREFLLNKSNLLIAIHLSTGIFFSYFSDFLGKESHFPAVTYTLSLVGILFIFTSFVGLTIELTIPLIYKFKELFRYKFENLDPLDAQSKIDSESELYSEYFSEILKLNKKMKDEQRAINKIKADTYTLAEETEKILSNLKNKVGMI